MTEDTDCLLSKKFANISAVAKSARTNSTKSSDLKQKKCLLHQIMLLGKIDSNFSDGCHALVLACFLAYLFRSTLSLIGKLISFFGSQFEFRDVPNQRMSSSIGNVQSFAEHP